VVPSLLDLSKVRKEDFNRIGKVENPTCISGALKTPDHHLPSCRQIAKFRLTYLKVSRPSGEVSDDIKDRSSILEFIRKTGIATRKRFVERSKEEGSLI
jgi:hypothetical protein